MIKLDLEHLLFPISFLELKYKYVGTKAMESIRNKYENGELAFLDVDKNNEVDRINKYVAENKGKYDNIVVLGIGGSALGTRAIFTALKGKFYNELSKEQRNGFLKLHILDNVDPYEIKHLMDVINLEKTLFCVISKSGSTLETVSQYMFFKKQYEDLGIDYKNHFVVVAGENSKFKKNSLHEGLEVFDIPDKIGGRFSAFTNVGLLPLAFVGIDIKEILNGVSDIKDKLLEPDFTKNEALITSLIQYHSYIELGKNITVFFPYIANFNILGQWYKQMIGESLGKGGIGVTLSDSVGVTDQHSQLQLYYDGPNDKLVVFLELEKFETDYQICCEDNFTFGNLMNTEKYGTEQSLSSYNKINYTIKLSDLNERSLGGLILFFEIQTAMLGELYGFNPFDQPGVEIGKKITKQKLKENIGKLEILESFTK